MAIFKPGELAILCGAAVVAGILHARVSLALWQLLGRQLYLAGEESDKGASQNQKKKNATITGARKRGKFASTDKDIDLNGAESLYIIPLTMDSLSSLPLYDLLDTLCFIATVSIVTFISYFIAELQLQVIYVAPIVILVSFMIYVLYTLYKIELLPPFDSAANKGYALLSGCLGFVMCIAMFAVESQPEKQTNAQRSHSTLHSGIQSTESRNISIPNRDNIHESGPFAWSPVEVAFAFCNLLDEAAKNQNDSIPSLAETYTYSLATAIKIIYCIIAGFLSAVLLAPAMRFARAFRLAQEPPEWARGQIRNSSFRTISLSMHIILPLLTILAWIEPFSDGILDTAISQLPIGMTATATDTKNIARALLLLLSGATILSNARFLAQKYLDATLTAWYSIKHSVGRSSSERSQAAALIRAKATAVHLMLGKAAIQNTAPAMMFIASGLIILSCSMPIPENLDSKTLQQGSLLISNVVLVRKILGGFVGFVAWWSSVAWICYCCLGLWLIRTGTIAV